MSDWPKVWLLFTTYKRTKTALGTIASLKKHLVYPNLHWHICDDGSGTTDDETNRWHIGVLTDAVAEFYPQVTHHEMDTPPGKFNTGGNINKGIKAARANGASIYMLVFDDWALLREQDIRPMVDILDYKIETGFIRLSYWVPGMAGVCVNYPSPRLGGDYMWIRLIRDWTTDHYMTSTQPFVAHMRFHDAYGYHPEHCNPGVAETKLCQQYKESNRGENGPQVLFPIGPGITHAPWGHMVGRAHHYAEQFGI